MSFPTNLRQSVLNCCHRSIKYRLSLDSIIISFILPVFLNLMCKLHLYSAPIKSYKTQIATLLPRWDFIGQRGKNPIFHYNIKKLILKIKDNNVLVNFCLLTANKSIAN